jgi:ferric iron reductase protein FhuF
MAVCVFDLDNTLGDFRIVDFFGLLLEPKVIPNFFGYDKSKKEDFFNIINGYSKKEKDLLKSLRDKLEKEIDNDTKNDKILRPNLKEILSPLVEQYKKHKIKGFIIYSNNANLYSLEYAGRAIEHMFQTPNLFIKYLDRNHEERTKDRIDHSGYPSKMVNTIRQYTNNKSPILFVDDLVHNDFYIDYENTTYIMIPPYVSDADILYNQIIIATFEDLLDELSETEKTDFFNLYHIKEILKIDNFNTLEEHYLFYSKPKKENNEFIENMPMIQEKIHKFIKKVFLIQPKLFNFICISHSYFFFKTFLFFKI